jgi:hypothetical protein
LSPVSRLSASAPASSPPANVDGLARRGDAMTLPVEHSGSTHVLSSNAASMRFKPAASPRRRLRKFVTNSASS